MQDWTQIITAKARHGSFVGRGAAQEDAYFAFFANEPKPAPRLATAANSLARRAKALLASSAAGQPRRRKATL